jgi:hypothetical protein
MANSQGILETNAVPDHFISALVFLGFLCGLVRNSG